MKEDMLGSRALFSLRALREQLWIKPLTYALAAIGVIFLARIADVTSVGSWVPDISAETIEKLLTVISASMLGVATFAVASMVSAYASAGSSATPRAFSLVIADSVSQNALSSFIGAFIYSIVGIASIKTGFYGSAGRFVIFLLTLFIFSWVVLTFVRWVDNIARLGRIGNTIVKVEKAAEQALALWTQTSALGGTPAQQKKVSGTPVLSKKIAYVQHIDVKALQKWAEEKSAIINICSIPGAFVSPGRPLLKIQTKNEHLHLEENDQEELENNFILDDKRSFSEDPRFGLIVLSEIGSRALSPAVNDPGTAIEIINRLTRILLDWDGGSADTKKDAPTCDRVYVPPLSPDDLLEDAFAAIEKDGVASVEVGVWLQKAYALLGRSQDPGIRVAASKRARLALERAEQELTFPNDLERIRAAATR